MPVTASLFRARQTFITMDRRSHTNKSLRKGLPMSMKKSVSAMSKYGRRLLWLNMVGISNAHIWLVHTNMASASPLYGWPLPRPSTSALGKGWNPPKNNRTTWSDILMTTFSFLLKRSPGFGPDATCHAPNHFCLKQHQLPLMIATCHLPNHYCLVQPQLRFTSASSNNFDLPCTQQLVSTTTSASVYCCSFLLPLVIGSVLAHMPCAKPLLSSSFSPSSSHWLGFGPYAMCQTTSVSLIFSLL